MENHLTFFGTYQKNVTQTTILSFVINKEGVPPIIDHILFSIGALVAGCLWWGISFLLKKGLQKGSILILTLIKKWRNAHSNRRK